MNMKKQVEKNACVIESKNNGNILKIEDKFFIYHWVNIQTSICKLLMNANVELIKNSQKHTKIIVVWINCKR